MVVVTAFVTALVRRHSLVTPIDWKRPWVKVTKKVDKASRQSLVTPIDWKPVKPPEAVDVGLGGRQSLVTPIDWKHQFVYQPWNDY